MDDEQLIGDVVASIVEKVLMNIGLETYNKVSEILHALDIKFSDCHKKPDILKFALKDVFGDHEYLTVVEKITTELSSLEDKRIVAFVQKLSE